MIASHLTQHSMTSTILVASGKLFFAISLSLGIDGSQLPVQSLDVKWLVRLLYSNYQDNKKGGLSQHIIRQSFPHHNWDYYFGSSTSIEVVSPRPRFCISLTEHIMIWILSGHPVGRMLILAILFATRNRLVEFQPPSYNWSIIAVLLLLPSPSPANSRTNLRGPQRFV